MAPVKKMLKREDEEMDSFQADSAPIVIGSDEGGYDYSDDAMDEGENAAETEKEEDGNDSELEIIERVAKPDEELPVEPTPFKLSSRKQFAFDIAQLVEKYGSATGENVRGQSESLRMTSGTDWIVWDRFQARR